MTSLNPYLTFNGNCEEAFNFYKIVFGGEFQALERFKNMPSEMSVPESEFHKIMHVSLPIGKESVLMGSDTLDHFGGAVVNGNNFSISISPETEDDARRIFQALSENGSIKMPMEKTFWGSLFGMLTDQFGIHWMVNYAY